MEDWFDLSPHRDEAVSPGGGDPQREPLAARMRPRTLDEVCGQAHLLGPGRPLRRLVDCGAFRSAIFYGPPGTGKTTVARAMVRALGDAFQLISAVESSVSELRSAVQAADERWRAQRKKTLVLIDEIHRFSKAQQDALLPHVERGALRLIGATTQNPFYAVNAALISRLEIFEFEPLKVNEVASLLRRALADRERGLGHLQPEVEEEVITALATSSGGDARWALNQLERLVLTQPMQAGRVIVTRADWERIRGTPPQVYDTRGDAHYDLLSAFIKCIRGSEPDAALYWLGRMLVGGEAPGVITRRLMISAAEDIGLADPAALQMAVACHHAVEAIGMPEGRIPLAETTLYLATAPKSHRAYQAMERVMEEIRRGRPRQVPQALRDSSHPGSRRVLGHGSGYLYAHDDPAGVAKRWLVEKMPQYYQPSPHGYEAQIAARLERWNQKRNGRSGNDS